MVGFRCHQKAVSRIFGSVELNDILPKSTVLQFITMVVVGFPTSTLSPDYLVCTL